MTVVAKGNKRAYVGAVEECERLRAELAAAKAAGYRQAADNAAEQVTLHGPDADAEMLVFFLQNGAELREQFAANQSAVSSPTT